MTARIVAVADAFDAMTSQRVYRTNANVEYAIEQIRKNKGWTTSDKEISSNQFINGDLGYLP